VIDHYSVDQVADEAEDAEDAEDAEVVVPLQEALYCIERLRL